MLSAGLLLAATLMTVTSAASISSDGGYCMHEGKKFYSGEQVVVQDCQYTCRCEVNTDYSFFMCEPLCKEYYDVMCSDGEEPILEMEDTSVPECKCPRYYCPKRQSMAHFIDYGMDNTFFEPELDLGAEDTDSDSSRYVD